MPGHLGERDPGQRTDELARRVVDAVLPVPNAKTTVRTKPQSDIEMTCRRVVSFLYVIAVKRGGSPTLVDFLGLPERQNGKPLTKSEVLFEFVQRPPPMPRRPDQQVPRTVQASGGGFRDWFRAHDVHVCRFDLA